jgi:hypothetical protein
MATMRRSGSLVLLVASTIACSARDHATEAGADAAPVDAPATDAIAFSMTTRIDPGKEAHRCQYVAVPGGGEAEIFVGGREHRWSAGVHHFGLYRTWPTELPKDLALGRAFDCFEGDADRAIAAFIAVEQVEEKRWDFPAGVGLPLRAGEILMLQIHALNTTAQALDARVDVTLSRRAKTEVQHRMGLLQFYDPFIVVPPKATATATARCPIPTAITLLTGETHMHRRGIEQEVFVDRPSQPAAAPFLRSTSWEHPTPWTGTMPIEAGSSIRFRCRYRNDEDREIVQGQSTTDAEMCMFWGYYYPAFDDPYLEACFGITEFGTGDKTCAQTTECLQGCPPAEGPKLSGARVDLDPCLQRCMVASCPSAGALIDAQNTCIDQHCSEACGGSGDCTACATEKCFDQAIACQTATCD